MALKSPHKPIRTCIGCGERREKNALLRIVRTLENKMEIDEEAVKPGRGAYLCYNKTCLELVIKRKSIQRSLKIPVPPGFLETLNKFLNAKR